MVNVANQTTQVNPDGSWLLANVGAYSGYFSAQVYCPEPDGSTVTGYTESFPLISNSLYETQQLTLGVSAPIPSSLQITSFQSNLKPGQTTQLQVSAQVNGFTRDVTSHTSTSYYATTNSKIATVTPDGLVTAVSPGNVSIGVINQGMVATANISVSAAVPFGTGTVSGQITSNTGALVSGVVVSLIEILNGQPGPSLTVTSDVNGNYFINSVSVGIPFVLKLTYPMGSGSLRTRFVTLPEHMLSSTGETLTLNAVVPALGTLTVTVLRADGTPFAGAGITESDSENQTPYFAGYCNSSGVLTIPNVVGTFGVSASDPNYPFPFVGSAGGTISPEGEAGSVTIQAPITGSIQGTVFAGDGQTPVYQALVSLADGPTNGVPLFSPFQNGGTALTDANGHYQFNNVPTGTQGFRVSASYYIVATQNAIITSPGQTVTVNITLPLNQVTGTVNFFDGTPVPNPNVFANHIFCCTGTPPQPGGSTFFSAPTGANGSFSVFLPDPNIAFYVGPYSLHVQDPESELGTIVPVMVTNVGVPQTLDITLPAAGTVSGTVTIAGTTTPYANAYVAITANYWGNGIYGERQVQVASDGSFSFDHVPVGSPFAIQAGNAFGNAFVSSGGALANEGQSSTVNLGIAVNTGQVSGTIFAADGVTPVSNAQVILQNLDSSGPLGFFGNGLVTNSSGFYQTTGNFTTPPGDIRVSASSPANANLGGLGTGVVGASTPAVVNVTLGNAYEFAPYYVLAGPDGLQYSVLCDGTLIAGPTSGIFDGAGGYSLTVDYASSFPCTGAGSLQASGREIVLGPATLGNIKVSRKVFSPSSGGFVRYLEILTNPGSTAVTAHVTVTPQPASGAGTEIVVAPSTTGNTYGVTDEAGQSEVICISQTVICSLPLGFVFGGPNASLGPSAINFLPGLNLVDFSTQVNNLPAYTTGEPQISYAWDVPLPAGGSAILMHFLVMRGLLDDAGAQAEAQALVNLTDTNALADMSASEQSNVVNFNLPITASLTKVSH